MNLLYHIFCSSLILLGLNFFRNSSGLPQEQAAIIQKWAEILGNELWSLGNAITRKDSIDSSYKKVNLDTKDPQKIIEEIVGNVSYMMDKKMEAVKHIIKAAEHFAENFTLEDTDREYRYYRSNPPRIYDSELEDPDDVFNNGTEMYLPMTTNNDTHFFNLAVNTNHSSVQVPTNVYHKHDEAESAIKWSQQLDSVFKENYHTDPALSWQYFGSSTGIMRHYPAMEWGPNDKGLFDCRIRTWFIEAATCTKDVIILMDNSGSMTGMHKHIATLIVHTILDTLSNNDYVNIMNYSETVDYVVPCFRNMTVQATEENIIIFKDALKALEPVNKSFVNQGLREAFNLLEMKRNDNESTASYNQAIMLITDGIQSNVSDIIQDKSSYGIRIFTFLVGKEATHHLESMWFSCSNRGYHSHVDALEQVTAAVYKYVLVFARPLVLYGEHPLSWTHAYYDETFRFENPQKLTRKPEKYRLLTSIAGPVLNKTKNKNETTANLLGVAASDVPVAEISKLMCHYKTGVNSHAFIVSNNGYVLKHPALKPMYEDILTDNYNSIDLTEVEQLDDDSGPREIGQDLERLREALVFAEKGVMHDLKIKYHYDNMRRISREINDYYYAQINGTPFSIGFAIPDSYGNYSIRVEDEITLRKFSSHPISDYFNGSNWRIHPEWVYCKYHYIENHEFDTPEDELRHFIEEIKSNDDFKWYLQYEVDSKNINGRGKILQDDDYYCDRDLVEHVVFDAKLTQPQFKEPWRNHSAGEYRLQTKYNATLRFISTMSGLTRWEYINITVPENDTNTFGNLHARAIDETWYKSAVIQYRFNAESYVYAVPFDSQEDEDLVVTGSSAIFPNEDGKQAPGAVVGFQFSHSHLKKQFFEITSHTFMCDDCLKCRGPNFESESGSKSKSYLDCYIIDSSGYIVVSNNKMDTGVFFGEIDGNIMNVMIERKYFEKVTIRDYQAICYYEAWVRGDGNILITPFYYLMLLTKWMLSQIAWMIVELNFNSLRDATSWLVEAAEEIKKKYQPSTTTPKPSISCHKKCKEAEEKWHRLNQIPVYKQEHAPCEKEHDLYILQQQQFIGKFEHGCVRTFYLKMIPHSNLLLIAIEAEHKPSNSCYFVHNTQIRDIVYTNETTFPCQKLYLNELKRRPLLGCYNSHPLEQEIRECGRSRMILFNVNLIIVGILLLICI